MDNSEGEMIEIWPLEGPNAQNDVSLEQQNDDDDGEMTGQPLRKYTPSTLGQKTLITRLSPVLHTLQFLGIYCLPLSGQNQLNPVALVNITVVLVLLVCIYTIVNTFLFGFNIHITKAIQDAMGLMNANTLTSMVTGIKPGINVVHFVFFAGTAFTHRSLLRQMTVVDNNFAIVFGKSPNVRECNRMFFLLLLFFTGLPLSVRIVEYIVMQEVPFQNILGDISVLLVPLLTTWNAVPLIYFMVINRLIRSWFRTLQEAIEEDVSLSKRNLRFYYRQFLRLTQLLHHVGSVFNPFIFFTVLWTVVTLCLSIYFFTQASTLFENALAKQRQDDFGGVQAYFNLTYCVMQVTLAGVYVGLLSIAGIKTNETAREILQTILEVQPQNVDAFERFQIICFMQKIQSQYMWGVSVWWAVPLERSTLFTLISMVMTYALLLMKLRPAIPPSVMLMPDSSADNYDAAIVHLKAHAQAKCMQLLTELKNNLTAQCERRTLTTVSSIYSDIFKDLDNI